MRLAPGTRHGPYEIARNLGESGMGEVCPATETRLGHDVAVKVLPARSTASRPRRSPRLQKTPNRRLHEITDASVEMQEGISEPAGSRHGARNSFEPPGLFYRIPIREIHGRKKNRSSAWNS
jgi:serine/threonine protein kinase